MDWRRTWMRARDVFAMREHMGWAHYMAAQVGSHSSVGKRLFDAFHDRLSAHTDARSAAFDEAHGTETFRRIFVPVRAGVSADQESWGYGPVNQDFFREMLRAVDAPYEHYTFIDVGAGKGAAVLLASEFGFRRYLGIELSGHLLEVAKRNVTAYRAHTGRNFEPEWIEHDFFQWSIPHERSLYFLNNPFPEELSLKAVHHIEASLRDRPREALLVYRKLPRNVGSYLHGSLLWEPLRLAPYWRIYAAKVPAAAKMAVSDPITLGAPVAAARPDSKRPPQIPVEADRADAE